MKYLSLLITKVEDSLDRFLDRFTTYRLVLYLLIIYIAAASVLAYFHKVPLTPRQILVSAVWLLLVSRVVNKLLARFLKVPANQESDLITGLILTLIMSPLSANVDYIALAAVAALAMATKYLLTWKGRHMLNPAAAGAFAAGLFFHTYASWWIGNKYMFPLVAIGGLLIVKKMKRVQMVLVMGAVFVSYTAAYAPAEHLVSAVWQALLDSSMMFFATVMLTEPLSSPTSLNPQLIYALVTGFLFSSRQLRLSPEEALLIGNVLTFVMSPNRSMKLRLVSARKEASEIYSYIFRPDKKLAFAPGQYMEWTLPGVRLDSRGNRRYLTIASSPTEEDITFSVRMPEKMSGYKSSLAKLKPGAPILAAQLAGDFVLPDDPKIKLVFVAGGIGVTPFRSMVKYLIDNGTWRDVSLIYSVTEPSQFAFTDVFNKAREVGVKSHYVVSEPKAGWKGLTGKLDSRLISQAVPDYSDRTFLISGPQGFVAYVRQELLEMGVGHGRIITDFFPGYN